MAWLDLVALPLFAKICLVCMFPFSAIDKILHWQDGIKQASSSFLPCAPCLLLTGMAVEILTPICIVFGIHDHIAAFILAGYCGVTAILFHNFWAYPDFWKAGNSVARGHFWDFTKNLCVAGGLLVLVSASSFYPLRTIITHPLISSPTQAVSK